MTQDNISQKTRGEMAYWVERKKAEGILTNAHYEYFYTSHFGLDRDFYVGKKILDIGCGPRGSLEWASMAKIRVGLDPLVTHYKEVGIDQHKMQYVASGSEHVPYADNYFDVVCSFNSLDHVDDLEATISEIKRVLTNNGLFLFLTELDHLPTECEPIMYSWDIVNKITDVLRIIDEKHFEKSKSGMYDSIQANVLYDHSNKTQRVGILSAKFIKLG